MRTAGARIETFEGRAVTVRGDVALAACRTRNTVEHNRWLWDRYEAAIARHGSIVLVLLVLPGTPPPEPEVRAQSVQLFTRHRAHLRRVLTVVEGDELWLNVVRSVARSTVLLSGSSSLSTVVNSEAAAVDAAREAATEHTPSRAELLEALSSLRAALREPTGAHPAAPRPRSNRPEPR